MPPLRPRSAPTRQLDLQETLLTVSELLDDSDFDVWLFGSRRHATGSARSDVDLLVRSSHAITQQVASRIWDLEPYFDVFTVHEGVATSVVNGSHVSDTDIYHLLRKLDAVPLVSQGTWVPASDQYRTQVVLAERNPAATLVPLYDLEDAVPAERADILVVTALPKEHAAVARALTGDSVSEPGFSCTVLDDKSSPWRVRVQTANTMGSVSMALLTADAIRRTKAAYVVLVGICAGIPKRSRLLDVVVPTYVAYYEPGKATPRGMKQDYAYGHCDGETVSRVAALFDETDSQVRVLATGQVMGCGEKVIADKRARKRLEVSLSRKFSAIDMESYGMLKAAEAAHRLPIVIKAVCDLGDRKKADTHQDEAAQKAAQALLRMIKGGVFAAAK